MVTFRIGAGALRRFELAFKIVCLSGIAIALVWFLRGLDVTTFRESIEDASPVPLLLAFGTNLLVQYLRAAGWRAMLAPRHGISLRRLVRLELTAQAASTISPAQGGEIVRAWMLKRDCGVPASTSGALLVLEKLFGSLAMVVLVVGTPWLIPGLPWWVIVAPFLFGAVICVLLLVLVLFARHPRDAQQSTFVQRVADGMYVLRNPRRMLVIFSFAVLGELVDLVAVILVIHALDIHLSLAESVLVLFLIDLMNLIPAGPGQFGSFEIAAVSAVELFPVRPEPALAFALLFHLQQQIPQLVIGLPFLVRVPFGRIRREPVGTRDDEFSVASPEGQS